MIKWIKYPLTLLIIAVVFTQEITSIAQNVGISNAVIVPDASSMLEVRAANKGLLIPRVNLTGVNDNATVPSPATSLLVYNTGSGGLNPAGYYYNTGTFVAPVWTMLSIYGGAAEWHLLGNSGTNPVNNFIGTTDPIDWVIRTNNAERIRVQSGGNVGIGTAGPTAKLEVLGPATGSGLTIRAGGGGDVMLNSGGSLFFDGNYSYAAGNYIRPVAANTQAFFTSGTERMRITPAGLVGVGVSNPAYNLEVNGTFGFGNGSAGLYRSRTETRNDAGQMATQSGFFETSAPAPGSSWPVGAASWWHMIDCRHSNNANNYALQIAGSFFDQNLYYRKTNNNASTAWTRFLTPTDLLWEDQTTYIKPRTGVGATYPYIYDDNNVDQMYINASSPNNFSGLYVYSTLSADGTSYTPAGIRSNIKAFDYWGNNYNTAISGFSYLDFAGSAAIIGAKNDGSVYTKLASKSAAGINCAAEMYGDFYNQETNYGQSTFLTSSTWLMRSLAITTHGTGVANSIVVIHGEIDYYKTSTTTYVIFGLFRDGVYISEISEYSQVNVDKTIHIQWIDEPAPGAHTYELWVRYPSGGMTYYGHSLQIYEIKR